MSELPYSAVLFDLDGTIVDSAPGITSSLAYTFDAMGLPIPSPAKLLEWIGPPIMDSFRDLAGFDPLTSARALAIYREHYVMTGVFDAELYPGVPDVLRAIAASDVPLSLATSKPESTARLILEHYDLARYFDELTGASEDEVRSAKADVVEEALRRLSRGGADLSRPVMVGDRHHDVIGAAAHDVPTIFVTWGYGAPEETAGTVAAVDTAHELRVALGLD
ncbi:HAD hydrolase-like protein [Pseudolysinimonas yzui]|uniref:Phosphoglycolate phosphatase n=1 Tax=Pseudolysinimonas yzui TaxID=2708254 RepID=A0A8J3GSY8_9MICO|nr:HAD hydrolase-like protein [Pseudolysinimonas yzui]GHF25496.1 phosphoglycolate phosphatase [Pseudolysinimonas yzui]